MSKFVTADFRCPHCGVLQACQVAETLSGPRVPELRSAILEDRFQRFECAGCARSFAAEGPFAYIDFEARHWLCVFPLLWEAAWRGYEQRCSTSFRSNVVENAPPFIQSMAESFKVRAVFGLDALRDKLVSWDARLDDARLEALKLELMRSDPALALHPSTRPRLKHVSETELVFTLLAPATDSSLQSAQLRVDRERLRRIDADPPAWRHALDSVSGGPYVDTGRVLIGGGAIPPASASH